MKLLTEELIKKFEKYPLGSQDGKLGDAKVIARFFNPIGEGTWFITEGDIVRNKDGEITDVDMFGYVNLMGLEYAELGYVSLKELENVRLPYNYYIERDLHFLEDINLRDACKIEFGSIPSLFKQKINYQIYQLKNNDYNHNLRFVDYDFLKNKLNKKVDILNYECLYSGRTTSQEGEINIDNVEENYSILESLFTEFNIAKPSDFKGHSLSVSDIIVLESNGISKAYYCDSFGFKKVDMPAFYNKEINLAFRLGDVCNDISWKDYSNQDIDSLINLINNHYECFKISSELEDYASELSIDLNEYKSSDIKSREDMAYIINREQLISKIHFLSNDLYDYANNIELENNKENNDIELDK